MTKDRRTKAQILEELERVEAEVRDLRAKAPAPRRLTPEVDALDKCVAALSALQGSTTSYSRSTGGGISWVLSALTSRFKVEGF